jgi:hypothetical protein
MALFTGMGLGAIAISWLLLVRMAGLNTTDRWLLALLFASSGPLQYSLKEGNTSHMVLAALAGALLLLRTGRSGLAGILLGMAAVLKPPILLLALFFAVRRDIRGLLGFVSSCVAAAALSLLLFGLADNLYWFNTCIVQFSHSWLAAFNVQSIPGFLFRLEASPALLLDWNAYAPPADLILPARILTVALFAIAGAVLLKNPPLPGATARRQGTVPCDTHYCLILCLAVVSSPLSWSHYYCWLLLPVAFFLSWRHALGWPARAPIWLAILLVTPLVRPLSFPQAWLNDGYKTFAVSHLLFGGLLCFALLAARLWRARSAASAASASQVIAQA